MKRVLILIVIMVMIGTVDSFGQGTVTRANKAKKETPIRSAGKKTTKKQSNESQRIQDVELTSEDLYQQGKIKEGKGNFQEAVELYKKAAEQGHYHACRSLGDIYYYGHGVPKNEEEGLEWYSKCADHSSAKELRMLAYSYKELGYTTKAIKYYQMSAEKGELMSYWYLGNILDKEGRINEAFQWYLKGAELNEPYCQDSLGKLYFLGLGVAENNAESIKWLKKSVDNGNENAKSSLKIWHHIVYP